MTTKPKLDIYGCGDHGKVVADIALLLGMAVAGFVKPVVAHILIKWDMNPLARAFIRWRRPHPYYRLTGME